MIANFFKNRNDFYGVTKEMTMNRLSHLNVEKESYDFKYSNFGFATLSLILESVYNTDYKTLTDNFLQTELELVNTRISDKSSYSGNYWDWKDSDVYLSAEDTYITITFCELSNGKLVTKGTYAKMAHGDMVRYMAENCIENPIEIKNFYRLGYIFRDDLSSETEYVFERRV